MAQQQQQQQQQQQPAPRAFVICGPAGCGKSSVGVLLAARLGCTFIDADDHHSTASKRKMAAGVPLSDEDRAPWLQQLAHLLRQHLATGARVVLACSALKPAYRDVLRAAGGSPGDVAFVLLLPSRAELAARLERRAAAGGHFMPPRLLDSQLRALSVSDPAELYASFEPHAGALFPAPEDIVAAILAAQQQQAQQAQAQAQQQQQAQQQTQQPQQQPAPEAAGS